MAGNAVAVKRAHGGESFEDHEVESALKDFGFRLAWHVEVLEIAPVGW